LDWNRLIEERNEWVAHNFPDPKIPNPQESLLGVIEEVGELAHAHLKELQNIRGTSETLQAEAKDAIGDATVYLWGVCNYLNYVPTYVEADTTILEPQDALFQLARLSGQLAEEIRFDYRLAAKQLIDDFVEMLITYCQFRQWDYEEIVTATWNHVKERDWQKNRETGGNESTADWPPPDMSKAVDSPAARKDGLA
jgi:NTP pyrophosphatase (non-canonical NTP hydrolase)